MQHLSDLAPGEKGRITGFESSAASVSRLYEMGLTQGTIVELVRAAPMGDPLDFRVRGYHLSLRRKEASAIKIERA